MYNVCLDNKNDLRYAFCMRLMESEVKQRAAENMTCFLVSVTIKYMYYTPSPCFE